MRYILIDTIDSINTNSIKGKKYITINEDIFGDHFPDFPVLPAAFMTEATIQLSRIWVWENTDFKQSLLPMVFEKFKFMTMVGPGSILDLDISFDRNGFCSEDGWVRVKVEGRCNQELAFSGTMLCKFYPFDKLHNEPACRNLIKCIDKSRATH